MFTGCGTALVTPFKSDLSVDEKALRALIERQITAGIDFLVPCGTTGESPTLEQAEQVRVCQITVEQANGRVPVLAGAGGYNTQHVIHMAHELEKVGVNGLLSVTPYYNKPSQAGLFAHYSALAEATWLPIITYSVPGRTGMEIGVDTMASLALKHPNIVAIKEAGGSIERFSQLRQALPASVAILSGDDSMTLPALAVGATGVISVASNLIPKQVVDMVRTFLGGRAK